MNQAVNSEISVTHGELMRISPDFAKMFRKATQRTRKPSVDAQYIMQEKENLEANILGEIAELRLDSDAIMLDDLPKVDALYISSTADEGLVPGRIVCTDPVLNYHASLAPGERPRQVVAAMSSASLRVVWVLVNGKDWVECILDGGSQIVSMSLAMAEKLSLTWDPDIKIVMQSANGELKNSCGMARNVPYLFNDIPIYLQVHIIDQPAYDVLLGRPFEILTQLGVENRKDGTQVLTIHDPNSNRRVQVPTQQRGSKMYPYKPKPAPSNGGSKDERLNMNQRSADFRFSSRS